MIRANAWCVVYCISEIRCSNNVLLQIYMFKLSVQSLSIYALSMNIIGIADKLVCFLRVTYTIIFIIIDREIDIQNFLLLI